MKINTSRKERTTATQFLHSITARITKTELLAKRYRISAVAMTCYLAHTDPDTRVRAAAAAIAAGALTCPVELFAKTVASAIEQVAR